MYFFFNPLKHFYLAQVVFQLGMADSRYPRCTGARGRGGLRELASPLHTVP